MVKLGKNFQRVEGEEGGVGGRAGGQRIFTKFPSS